MWVTNGGGREYIRTVSNGEYATTEVAAALHF